MMAARFVQGLAGGWAMVTARAVIVDLARGPQLVRSLNLVAGVGGVAPIVGPAVGRRILQLSHWRVSFWVVAVLGAADGRAVWSGCRSRCPAERRHRGGLTQLGRGRRGGGRQPPFVGYVVVRAFSMGVTFAYVATSAFVLQSMNGLSPIAYSVDFAVNAVGLAARHPAGRPARRSGPDPPVIAAGLV